MRTRTVEQTFVVLALLSLSLVSLHTSAVHAATGISQQINYQARLLNAQGAVVPDGTYNIQFKIYKNGDGTTAGDTSGSPAGTQLWTESWQNSNSQGVTVKNGYLSVQLGAICALSGGSCQGNTNAGVDFNQSVLYLSINIGGTTTGPSPTYDGEMLPMRQMAAAPYAMNAGMLGGLTASQFIQNIATTATPQNASINIQGNSSNAEALIFGGVSQTGDLLQFQLSGAGISGGVEQSGAIYTAPVGVGAIVPTNARLFVQPNAASSIGLIVRAAYAGGGTATGDILDLQNNSSTNVLSVSATGSVVSQASTNSTSALQVRNASGAPVLNVDTTADAITTNLGPLTVAGVADPATPTLSSSSTGGSLAADTYYYAVAAIGASNQTTAATTSNPASVTTTGSTSRNTLTWSAVANATGYAIYRSTDDNTWYVNTVSATTTSAIDNGTNFTWSTSGSPSQSNFTGGINLQDGTALVLDGGTGGANTSLAYYPTYNYVGLTNANSGGGLDLQSNNFAFRDTNAYHNDFTINGNGAAAFSNNTDTTAGFQIQNSSGSAILTADTANRRIVIGTGATSTPTPALLVLNSGSSATDPSGVTGAMYYNASTNNFRCYQNGTWQNCIGGLSFSSTAPSTAITGASAGTIVNWTTDTNSNSLGYPMPTNDCQPGVTYQVTASGLYSNPSGVANGGRFTLNLDGTTTTILSSPAGSGFTPGATGLTNAPWQFTAQVICDTAGTSGSIEVQGSYLYENNSTTTSAIGSLMYNTSALTLNTTAAHTMYLGFRWNSGSNSGSTITMRQYIVQRLGS